MNVINVMKMRMTGSPTKCSFTNQQGRDLPEGNEKMT